MFREAGMDAVILKHNIDNAFISHMEQLHDNIKFQRIDADVTDTFKEETDADALKETTDTLTDVFRKALAFYLSRLPEDMIPCWDMLFAPESGEPRDSSSAAIVACGLLEAAKYVDETEAAQWRTLARQMLASLAANYAVKPGTLGSGQLLHGTYSKKSPYNTCTPEGVDECTSWGDYFYMEALTRLTKDWEMYW